MRKTKKILSIILAILMIVTTIPTAFATVDTSYALMYQAPGSDEVEYNNDISYLTKPGTVTLLQTVYTREVIGFIDGETTVVLNGHSIVVPAGGEIVNHKKLTFDVTAGGSICFTEPTDNMDAIFSQSDHLKIVGNLTLGENTMIALRSEETLDLTEYTGEGLLLYGAIGVYTYTPVLADNYVLIKWTEDNGDGERLPDNTFTYGVIAKVVSVCLHESFTDVKCDSCDYVCAHETITDSECEICGEKYITLYINWGIGFHVGSYEILFYDSEGNELMPYASNSIDISMPIRFLMMLFHFIMLIILKNQLRA